MRRCVEQADLCFANGLAVSVTDTLRNVPFPVLIRVARSAIKVHPDFR
jgi:hypothetical protein